METQACHLSAGITAEMRARGVRRALWSESLRENRYKTKGREAAQARCAKLQHLQTERSKRGLSPTDPLPGLSLTAKR